MAAIPSLRAGVAYRPFHTTRHTAASVAFAAGVPISEISKTLGHTSERTTQDIYQHQFSKIRSAAPDAVADALFSHKTDEASTGKLPLPRFAALPVRSERDSNPR